MNARFKNTTDPWSAWRAHCVVEFARGDKRHLCHSDGGDATCRFNDAETYCECGVEDCRWVSHAEEDQP